MMPHVAEAHDSISLRAGIGAKVRELRRKRRLTQAQLAERLQLSQARLSEIERGQGSFTAEHLLEIFRLFNVDASHFAPVAGEPRDLLQNALARLGARHLFESERSLPSEQLAHVHDVVREALVDAAQPRLLTAIAPVLVHQIDRLQLGRLHNQLADLGLQHRLGWIVDNTLEAIARVSRRSTTKPALLRQLRRAELVLDEYARAARKRAKDRKGEPADILDPTIRSDATLSEARTSRSKLSRRWGIISTLKPADFANAIEEAYEQAA